MKNLHRSIQIIFLALVIVLLAAACTTTGADNPSSDLNYLPRTDDEVLIFTHRFNPEDFEEGKRIVFEDFSAAIDASGQTRRTYFLDNPDTAEFVVLSYFHSDDSTQEWLDDPVREEILTKLRPLYREPLQIELLFVEEIHDTN